MRPIKFRAWGLDGSEGPKMWPWEYIRGVFDIWLDDGSIIMQYTGLNDKNGQEIYEEDVVEILYNNIGNIIVEFVDGRYNISRYMVSECVVIGNIYENPKLKKKGAK